MYAVEYAGDWSYMLASSLVTGHVLWRVCLKLVMYAGEYAGYWICMLASALKTGHECASTLKTGHVCWLVR